MLLRYSTAEGIFETNYVGEIPRDKLHSINNKPAFENLFTGFKSWYIDGKWHRETGPARIWPDGKYEFYLNGNYYENINDWLIDNPNKDITFQTQMRLKYS